MDGEAGSDIRDLVIGVAGQVPMVVDVEKCRIRKSGVDYFVEMHIHVPLNLSVAEGHAVGHRVKDVVMAARSAIRDVIIHVEPATEEEPPPENCAEW